MQLRYVIIGLIILSLAGCKNKKQNEQEVPSAELPIRVHQFEQLTSHEELIEYVNQVDTMNDFVTVEYIGKSVEGRKLPLVKISNSGNINKELLTIFFFAQQHGDEPSGKEGMLMLIDEFSRGKHKEWLQKVNILIMPQVNPDGGEKHQRENANGTDLNRDHLVLSSPEVRAVHSVFHTYQPEVTIDVHEYTPYSTSWREFGYLKDFDIQLGGLTNKNIDTGLKRLFYDAALPYVKEYVTKAGYSFFEYTLGDLPEGERLRHSTVDVNDGRQSFGILNKFSFIVEGKNGKDSVDRLERRAKSQLRTAKGLIRFMVDNHGKVKEVVTKGREKLKNARQSEKVAIRMHHVKGDKTLKYPLKSLKTGEDTTFHIEKFHAKVISVLDVNKPSAYLIPVNDKKLVNWMKRSYIDFHEYEPAENHHVNQYFIEKIERQVDEGLENYYPEVDLQSYEQSIEEGEYYAIPINQLRSNKIVTALEPQSMLGLVNYDSFEYLLLENDKYPVLRVEKEGTTPYFSG
jgi:hypothetical protein